VPPCTAVLFTVASYQTTHTLHVICLQHSFPSSCISSSVLSKLLLPFMIICAPSQFKTGFLTLHEESAWYTSHTVQNADP